MTQVVEELQEKYGPELYTAENVLLSGTHTHSGPAGFLQYVLFDVTSLGFYDPTFQSFLSGIVKVCTSTEVLFSRGKETLEVISASQHMCSFIVRGLDQLQPSLSAFFFNFFEKLVKKLGRRRI